MNAFSELFLPAAGISGVISILIYISEYKGLKKSKATRVELGIPLDNAAEKLLLAGWFLMSLIITFILWIASR
jgi:hypothetical protein